MTDHDDELKVAPDPLQAEELRRRLHARLALASGHDRQGRPDLDLDAVDVDPDERVLELKEIAMSDTSTSDRRPRRRLMVGAAALVIAIAGAGIAISGGDSGDDDKSLSAAASPDEPTTEPPRDINTVPEGDLEPGTYFIDPDGDRNTPLRVTFAVAGEGWQRWVGAVKESGDGGHVAVTITTVSNVVRHGCDDHNPAEPAVGPTVDDLAAALSKLPPFEVSAPPSDVTVFGYEGKHLALTVPDVPVVGQKFTGCETGQLHSYMSATLEGAFYGYDAEPGRVDELWILDVDGTRLLVAANYSPASPPEDVAEMRAIFESIEIEP